MNVAYLLGHSLDKDPWEVVKTFPKWLRLRIGKAFFLWSKYECWCVQKLAPAALSWFTVEPGLLPPEASQPLPAAHSSPAESPGCSGGRCGSVGFLAMCLLSFCHSRSGARLTSCGSWQGPQQSVSSPGDVLPLLTPTYMYSCTHRKLSICKQLCPKLGFHFFSAGGQA